MTKTKGEDFQHSINKDDNYIENHLARKKFSRKLLLWYAENKRDLPWRNTKDPYKIWLSEIILQQTRVAQGIPYYQRFIRQFPTVFSLAKASEQEVLRLWQGLGYYTRARNLHHCAKELVENFQGKFPDNFKDLKKLKGIGHYTAAAIASISFHQPIAVVDGNVFRVLARIYGITQDISESKTKDYFFALGDQLISNEHPDEFNQAIMEFGATHCLPKNPLCETCIFKKECIANAHDLQAMLPIKTNKLKVRKRYFYYVVARKGNKLAMRRRNGKDIWHGLFDFYLDESNRRQGLQKLRDKNKMLMNVQPDAISKTYKHVLSHQQLHAKFITVNLRSLPAEMLKGGLKFYGITEIKKLPKPVLILRYLKDEGILE